MNTFSDRFIKGFRYVLPAPFTIAVVLTAITFLIALFFTKPEGWNTVGYGIRVLQYWEAGLWKGSMLIFAIQMMLMLVLGHVLALTKPIDKLIRLLVRYCDSTAKAALIVTLVTMIVSFFNWGLGLVFGAILARKVAEYAQSSNRAINYGVIGAAGYSGLMVWHGGISGSAPIKVNEAGHFFEDKIGIISLNDTIFSSSNLMVWAMLLIIVPAVMYLIGKKSKGKIPQLDLSNVSHQPETAIGAEKLNHALLPALIVTLTILGYLIYKVFVSPDDVSMKGVMSQVNPNNINLTLFALAIGLHGSFYSFLKGIDSAIGGASGILIQFPLYFGIMGIMEHSGLAREMSDFFVSIAREDTLPFLTYISAGIVNIFVPSGGGQWAIQGNIVIDSANQLGVPISKNIMALAYGDQLTNMLQPFWALPLLGITQLKAKDILPYTLILFLTGGIIFAVGLFFY